ncbi:MAG TPA: DUF2336 domain-containing protein [Azospirillaceae bacterium]|nr:DUF2336 domain-containing protein [Azospirillaceae bacterium]
MAQNLTKDDVLRLLSDPSGEARADLAAKVGAQLDVPTLTPVERRLAEDIVRRMAQDAEVRVRQALAEHVKQSSSLPRDVAQAMAMDVESVALPVIQLSQVLTDADLIDIVRSGDPRRQVAVAARPDVSETVSEVIVSEADEAAVATLMRNDGARIAEASFSQAIDRFGADGEVAESMAGRVRLPLTVSERLVALLSGRLVDRLAARHDLSPQVLSDLVLHVRERATASLLETADDAALEQLVAQLADGGRLTPSLILRMLCTGDVAFLEAALARLADVPLANARILVHDGGSLGLRAIYDRAGLPAALLPAVRVALSVIRETPYDGEAGDRDRYRRRILERILTQYEDMAPEDLDYLLHKLGDLVG